MRLTAILLAALAFWGFRAWGPQGRGPSGAAAFPDGFTPGLNYPWINYGWDFGDTAWGHRGVSLPRWRAAATADLARMRAAGAGVVRWFLFCDGRAAPEFDAGGLVTGFDGRFYADLDAALELAGASGVKLVLVLFDFHLLDEGRTVNGAKLGGRAALITDPAARRSLFDKALAPLFRRYGARSEILAWDIMNEPEWRMGAGGANGEQLRSFVRETAALIHAHASQPVTLGAASSASLAMWKGLGLDFYQYHYYENMRTPFAFDPAGLRLGKPCVLGEFATAAGNRPVGAYLETAAANGLAGAWAWSWRAGDAQSDREAAAMGLARWTAGNRAK